MSQATARQSVSFLRTRSMSAAHMVDTSPLTRVSKELQTAVDSLTKAGFFISFKGASVHTLRHDESARDWTQDGAAIALGTRLRESQPEFWPQESEFSSAVDALSDSIQRSWANVTPAPVWIRPDILTVTGAYFNIFDGARNAPSIYVIGQGLSNESRFAGQCEFYSVAQHCVLASYIVPTAKAYAALMHDMGEAILKDMPKPIKVHLHDYQAIEHIVEKGLQEHFQVPAKCADVHRADVRLLATEQRDLMPHHDDEWALIAGVEPLPFKIRPWSPRWARFRFLSRYAELRHGRKSLALQIHLLAHIYLPKFLRPAPPAL